MLWFADEEVNYEVAKYQCDALESRLVEFWTESELFQVNTFEL